MSTITQRRGPLRPISSLPASASASLIEVEDADGSARKVAYSSVSGGGPIEVFSVGDYAGTAVTANLSAKAIQTPGTPPRWTAWEYAGATSAWQTDSFNAYRKIPAGSTPNVARTNVDVTTARMRAMVGIYRNIDVVGQAIILCIGVPDESFSTWNQSGFMCLQISRQGGTTVLLQMQHRDALTTITSVGGSVTVSHPIAAARYYWLTVNGGALAVYQTTTATFTGSPLIVANLPTTFIGPTSAYFPNGRRGGIDAAINGLNGNGMYPQYVSFEGY